MAFVGQSVPRLEDRPLVTGQGRFAADVSFPHQLHMRVVRSALAHGRLVAIDTAAALQLPGVVAVVFATDPYVAEDAADLVAVTIDELPVIVAADGAVGIFAGQHTTEPTQVRKNYGDVDAAFRSADATVELKLSTGRHSAVPMETRGAIGRYDASRDVLEMYGAAKVPHWNRDQVARMLKRSPSQVHFYEGHVGGGFGVRGELYPEDVLVCAAALRFGRPVKWIEDRREHLIAANHSRQQIHHIRAAVDDAGKILAIENEFFHDQGAYVRTHAATVPDLAAAMLLGPYHVPNYRTVGHIRLTNKTPGGTYRAPGRFESTFVRERLMDAIAARVGITPVEARRRNMIGKEEMPFERPIEALGTHVVYDSGDYAGLLDKSLQRIGWDELQASLKSRRAAGECVGAGVGMFVEKSGLGPFDGVRITVDISGKVEVVTGAASVGQGVETVIAQICADALGVDYAGIRVVHGQTDRIDSGMGAFASRVTVMTGEATRVAALKLKAKAIGMAAELMQADVADLDVVDGSVCVRNGAKASIALADVARHLLPASHTRGDREPGLTAEGWFFTDHMNYPYGVHVAVVRVDPETGGIDIEKYLVAYDIGRAINPMLVKGQIVGGFAQGLGGTIFEEFCYDDHGEPLSVTFADYLMPTAHEVPEIDVLITEDAPSPLNHLGVKGAGEGGTNAVGAAIASAVDDALGMPGAVTQLPITPQRLKDILARAKTAG